MTTAKSTSATRSKGDAPPPPIPANGHAPIKTVRDLVPDDVNANLGTERGQKAIQHSLKKLGAGRSILLDRNGKIIAGNKTVENAQALGINDLIIVQSDGKKLVAVQRVDLDLDRDPNARELAIADNRTGELNLAWAGDILKDLAGKLDLKPYFDAAELKKLFPAKADGADEGPEPQIDRADELRVKWETKTGQIWEIPSSTQPGRSHRLRCGNSTERSDVDALMGDTLARMVFTDPPWNVAIGQDSNPRHRQRKGLDNDDLSPEDFGKFLGGFAEQMTTRVNGDVYVVMSSSEWPVIDAALRNVGLHWSGTIVWVKDSFVLGRSNYHRRFEPIWYGWHKKGKSSFNKARDLDDVWEIPRPKVSEEHPTMKPVALPFRAILNSSDAEDVVYEPFVGAGSTMIAAEQLGRLCRAMEKDPKYVAVTLQRLKDMGLKPKLQE